MHGFYQPNMHVLLVYYTHILKGCNHLIFHVQRVARLTRLLRVLPPVKTGVPGFPRHLWGCCCLLLSGLSLPSLPGGTTADVWAGQERCHAAPVCRSTVPLPQRRSASLQVVLHGGIKETAQSVINAPALQ